MEMKKGKQKSAHTDVIIVFLSALCAVLIGAVRGFQSATIRMEEQNDRLLQRVRDMEKLNKQKCIDLFMK